MGKPIFQPEIIPVKIESQHEKIVDYPLVVGGTQFDINCVSMGNPHAISFISEPVDSIDLIPMNASILTSHFRHFIYSTSFL